MINYIKTFNKLSNSFESKTVKFKNDVIELSNDYIKNIFDLTTLDFIKKKKNDTHYFDLKILKSNKDYSFLCKDSLKNYRSEICKCLNNGLKITSDNMNTYNKNTFLNDKVFSDIGYLKAINNIGIKRVSKTKNTNVKNKDIKTFKNKTIKDNKQLNEFMLSIRNSLIKKLNEYSFNNKQLTIDDFYNFDVNFNDQDIQNKKVVNQ